MTLELIITALLAFRSQPGGPAAPIPVSRGDRVVVTDDRQSIRGRIAEITSDSLVIEREDTRVSIPVARLRRDRLARRRAEGFQGPSSS